MKVLEKIRKVIDLILSSACAIVFAVMVVVGTYQVVVRYFFNSPEYSFRRTADLQLFLDGSFVFRPGIR